MNDASRFSAQFQDLLLKISKCDEGWEACVEEIDDPSSGLSDGTHYADPEQAKVGAIAIARELFGTNVPEQELAWR